MNNNQRIKETAKDLGIAFQIAGTTSFASVAEVLVNAGYCKSSDVALEVITEIETLVNKHMQILNVLELIEPKIAAGGKHAFELVYDLLTELKNKYTKGGETK